MEFEKPENELVRLSFLRSADILDTPAEEAYERIVRMACRVLGFSRCAITLVDENRVWVKASKGIKFDELPRDRSFCAYTILSPEPLIVNDALSDDRFRDLEIVTGAEQLRFHVGCPIRLSPNVRIGSLCLFDTEARVVSADDLEFLRDLADAVAAQVKSRLLRTVYDEDQGGMA